VRICLKIDFNIDTNETNISNCAVKIHNNYTYLDESLNNNDTYNKIKHIYKNKNSSQIIELLMIKTNTICAEYMKKYKNGIYKVITHSEKLTNSSYELYNDTCNYLTVTSPIRRLIDIINIYKLSDNEKIFKFNDNAEKFYLNWINELKYINLTSKNIRKVQSKCNILNICLNNNHSIYKGKVFDKITIKNMFKYQVYIEELKIYSKLYYDKELDESIEYNFKIYVFQNEVNLKNKIKLDIIFTD
jgi:exoribonuclease R